MSARLCAWCDRETHDYLVHEITADHGPVAVVWCADWRACWAARTPADLVVRLTRPRAYPS